MGEPSLPSPALRLLAVTSRYPEALAWTIERTTRDWGRIALQSPTFEFTQTSYYDDSMGPDLKKTFLVFEDPYDLEKTAATKLQTNAWEAEYTRTSGAAEPRPLNLDPGYITAAKLVLSSTKAHAHRIYLSHGIYAEVTLFFQHGRWREREWTFPDYRRDDYHAFFFEARELLRRRQRERRAP